MKIKILYPITLSILFFACSESSPNADSKDEADKSATMEESVVSISFQFKHVDDYTDIFLSNGENEVFVTTVSSPNPELLESSRYNEFDIPKDALLGVSSFWAGLNEVIYVKENGATNYAIYFAEMDEMEEGNYQYDLLREIDFEVGKSEVKPPYYIINTAAVKTTAEAEKKVKALRNQGYDADYLWIPDWPSLSGAEYYTVFIGPFKTKQECAITVDLYRNENPKAYGTLVSKEPGRVTVGGLRDAE